MVTILMMSAKMATPGLRKIKIFWKKGYDIIISVNEVTNKILSRDSNNIVDVVMWSQFGNSSMSAFFEGWSRFKFNNLGQTLDTNLKFNTSVARGLKLKVWKFWGLIPTFVEITREKLVGERRHFWPPSSWIGLKQK